jgi:hypothetical protein
MAQNQEQSAFVIEERPGCIGPGLLIPQKLHRGASHFRGFSSLTRTDLTADEWATIIETVRERDLKWLDVAAYYVKSLPENFGTMISLTQLYLNCERNIPHNLLTTKIVKSAYFPSPCHRLPT